MNPMRRFCILCLALHMPIACIERAPESYDDCILKHVKAGMNGAAVRVLRDSCRAKYPESNSSSQSPKERPLEQLEVLMIDGRGGRSISSTHFVGSLYNGNEALTVTSVRLRISTTVSGKPESKDYVHRVSIAPRSTTELSFGILAGASGTALTWNLVGGTGVPIE